jgi:hypothetical protein
MNTQNGRRPGEPAEGRDHGDGADSDHDSSFVPEMRACASVRA